MGENVKRHDSYGMIQISRTQGGNQSLFGSSVRHNNKIELRIYQAEVDRHLNNDWYHSYGLPYIQIQMSPTQFAEAITNMNTSGVPCTIKSVGSKRMGECPFESKRETFDNEFQEKMSSISGKLNILTDRAEEILKGSKAPKKSEREEIFRAISNLKSEIKNNIPFIKEQFTEQMDKTVLEAKGEIEALWLHKIHQLGLEGLENEKIKLLEGNSR